MTPLPDERLTRPTLTLAADPPGVVHLPVTVLASWCTAETIVEAMDLALTDAGVDGPGRVRVLADLRGLLDLHDLATTLTHTHQSTTGGGEGA